MRLFRLLAPALLAGAFANTGCTEPACGDVYHQSGTILEIESGDQTGAYHVEVVAENQLLAADYTIDADSNVTCAVHDCADHAEPIRIGIDPAYPAVLEGRDHTFRLRLTRTLAPKWGPETFHLRVLHDGEVVHDKDHTPVYLHSFPDGEACPENVVATIPVNLTL